MARVLLAPGTRVGDYHIEETIGKGGMGTVYAAVHPVIGKKVAIKVLDSRYAGHADVVQRFLSEARAVNKIGHPNIVDIFACGTVDDGVPYLVMERLTGKTLGRLIRKRGRLSLGETLSILRPVVEAVDAAHAHGIIHRDLKPDNIFLVEYPNGGKDVKVLDFGVAKLTAGSMVTTTAGVPVGTPLFMSPEQCQGRNVDARADVYAFGVIVFHAITGRYPIEAESIIQIISKHMSAERVRPSQHGIDPRLDGPILRCLDANPARRFASLTEAYDAIHRIAKLGVREPVDVVNATRMARGTGTPPVTTGVLRGNQLSTPAVGAATPLVAFEAPRGRARRMSQPVPSLPSKIGTTYVKNTADLAGQHPPDMPPPPADGERRRKRETGPKRRKRETARVSEPIAPDAGLPDVVELVPSPASRGSMALYVALVVIAAALVFATAFALG